MINEVYHLDYEFAKSIGFDSANLYVSNLQFENIEGLRNECIESVKRSSQKIPLDKIQKNCFKDDNLAISVFFLKDSEKLKNFYFEGFEEHLRAPFVHALLEHSGISNVQVVENKKRDFIPFYISLIATIVGTIVLAWVASGPRTGTRTRLIRLMQDIGPMGICIIGGTIFIVVLIKMFRYSKKPANQHIYSRL